MLSINISIKKWQTSW